MKFFSKIQIFGVALATCVALSLTACGESKGGGENKEQNKEESKEQGKEQSKERNSQLSAYVKRQCPQCVFAGESRYETFDVGSSPECKTADYYRSRYAYAEAIGKLDALQVRFNETFKIEKTIQHYKVRDDYAPEYKWGKRSFTEYAITLLSMPEGVKKVAVVVSGFRLEDFTAPQQTQKVYSDDGVVWLRTSALYNGEPFCIKPHEVKQDNATEQIKPRGIICDKADTPDEELICSDNELAILHNEFFQALQNVVDAGKRQFIIENRGWFEPYKTDQCTNKECVKQNLQKQTEILKSIDLTNETPNTQSADEAKTSEQSPASEQVKPSFDCAKASTNAEKLVCSDNELANLDNELSKAYTNARNLLDNAGKKELTSEQKAWLETHNQCADKECVKQSLQKRIELLKSTDMRIYLETKDEFVNLRKAPNGEIITPIYKKDFDKIILKRLGVEDKWLKVLYFPPNVSDEKEALTGYIHNSQIK